MSQQDRLPTESEWTEWLQHPATRRMHSHLRRLQHDLKEQWASGAFTDQSQFGTAIQNAKAIGQLECAERVLSLEYLDLIGEPNE